MSLSFDPQASDPQASDPQASDPQASDPQAHAWFKAAGAFLQAEFGASLRCAFYGGSRISGKAGENSDVDLVVLCHHLPRAVHLRRPFQGFVVDCKAHDAETLAYELKQATLTTYTAFFPHFLAHAVLDPPADPIGMRFQEKAMQLWRRGPQIKEADLLLQRLWLVSVLDDLRSALPLEAERAAIVLQAVNIALRTLLLFNDRFTNSPGVWLWRFALEVDADFCAALWRHWQVAATNPAGLITFLEAFLEKLGGVPDHYRYESPQAWRLPFPSGLDEF